MNAFCFIAAFALSQTPAPINDDDWTPRPAKGKAEPWESHTDKDWIDKRFRKMDTGPFLNCSLEYPYGIQAIRVTRGTAIKVGDKGEATVVFDRNLMRWAAGWTGGWLELSDRRFGLLNVALPIGQMAFSTPVVPGYGSGATATAPTEPLPAERAAYKGLYLHGNRVVIALTVDGVAVWESPRYQKIGDFDTFIRDVKIDASGKRLRLLIGDFPDGMKSEPGSATTFSNASGGIASFVGVLDLAESRDWQLKHDKSSLYLEIAPGQKPANIAFVFAKGPTASRNAFDQAYRAAVPGPIDPLLKAGRPRWTPVETKPTAPREAGSFVVDSLTVPHDNPFKALMFLSGVDFLPNRDLIVSAAHGDVWLVSGADDKLAKLTWRRFATGLYQPLGVKVVDGKTYVIERGQITRLHDLNGDGEADFYENFNSDWHVGHGPHSFDTCLETDSQGNFYFLKTGDTETPTGGCLMRVASDGKKAAIYSTGFRHPIGLGISPADYITGADQEGNWMPSTRIDHYKQGGFYGDMRAHHRKEAPKIYDPPICWVPHHADGSAGGQVWVPKGSWGPLSERCLHMSYGRCNLHLLSKEEIGDVPQGGLIDLKLTFSSGVFRARFNPHDGHLYLAGLRGWQNAAKQDGCLERVRYNGKPMSLPLDINARKDGLLLTFSQPLDKAAAENVANYRIAEWNYRWSGDYGSKRYSVKHPINVGQDDVSVLGAKLLNERTVLLTVADLHPVMQMQIGYNLRTQAGEPLVGFVYNTINAIPK